MTELPYHSIITATRGYSDLLFERCIPSVQAQTVACEHIIVSEADERLRGCMRARVLDESIRYVEVGQWNRDPALPISPGAMAYYVGTHLAHGRYIGFCGDDDELMPDHMEKLVHRIEADEADFAVSKVDFRVNGNHREFIGDKSLALNKLDTIGIVCGGWCFHEGRWRQTGDCSDHDLVQQWLDRGLTGTFLDDVTAIHHDGWLKLALESRGVEV